jgi:hypothetical protein
MASASRADLLHALPLAIRSRAEGGLTTAADLRGFLAAMLAAEAEAPAALPVPQLQIRGFSGALGEVAPTPELGRLASPSGASTAAAGVISTPNYLRLSFGAPLPAAVLAAHPEVWLFTYHNRSRRPSRAGGRLRQAGWGHPCPAQARHQGAFWGGANAYGAATEFYGPAVQQSLALPRPYADLVIDANHWFEARTRQQPRPHGKHGRVRRFRFALVTDAPAAAPTPSGKRLGPLSDEVWLSAHPRYGFTACAFHAPVYNHLYSS